MQGTKAIDFYTSTHHGSYIAITPRRDLPKDKEQFLKALAARLAVKGYRPYRLPTNTMVSEVSAYRRERTKRRLKNLFRRPKPEWTEEEIAALQSSPSHTGEIATHVAEGTEEDEPAVLMDVEKGGKTFRIDAVFKDPETLTGKHPHQIRVYDQELGGYSPSKAHIRFAQEFAARMHKELSGK